MSLKRGSGGGAPSVPIASPLKELINIRLEKAYEISDARIQFVSLVDRAANKRRFLITKAQGNPAGLSVTKAEGGRARFTASGRILKIDRESHYLTGIVYEPMTADAHDNFMTSAEITKAAHWFMKHGGRMDLQHSFQEAGGLNVVESFVAPCEMRVGGQTVPEGAWVLTVEVRNEAVWAAVRKGEITGFSMGGIGRYSEANVNLNVQKEETGMIKKGTRASARLAARFGKAAHVRKEDMMEEATVQEVADALSDAVTEAVQDAVSTTMQDAVTETVQDSVAETIQIAVASAVQDAVAEAVEEVLPDVVQEAVAIAIEETLPEVVSGLASEAVAKALTPILRARGLYSNLNDAKPVAKAGRHYLTGIL